MLFPRDSISQRFEESYCLHLQALAVKYPDYEVTTTLHNVGHYPSPTALHLQQHHYETPKSLFYRTKQQTHEMPEGVLPVNHLSPK